MFRGFEAFRDLTDSEPLRDRLALTMDTVVLKVASELQARQGSSPDEQGILISGTQVMQAESWVVVKGSWHRAVSFNRTPRCGPPVTRFRGPGFRA